MNRIVCIGASAGGFEAVKGLLSALPAEFPAPIFVVIHVSPQSPNTLDRLLGKSCRLPVETATDGTPFRNGHVYLARPDFHLLIERRYVRVQNGPKENFSRPSIDVLFRSATLYHRNRVIGVLLSGELDDGTAGLWAIQRRRGVTIVQDPEEATFTSMPLSAIRAVKVDFVLPIAEIAKRLVGLVNEPTPFAGRENLTERKSLEVENDFVTMQKDAALHLDKVATPTSMICAECGGPLWEMKGGPTRYRCHVGHSYTESSFFSAHVAATDRAVWQAVRALQEEMEIARKLLGSRSLAEDYRKLIRERQIQSERRLDRLVGSLQLKE